MQEKQTQEEKEKITSRKSKIITIRIILLFLVGISSMFIPAYLGIHTEWVEGIIGLTTFISLVGLLSFIFFKALSKHPTIASFAFTIFTFLFITWASLVAPNKDAIPVLRLVSLSMLATIFWMIYTNIGAFISFFEKKFSFIHFSQNIGKVIGFLSVAALLILTSIQIYNAFYK